MGWSRMASQNSGRQQLLPHYIFDVFITAGGQVEKAALRPAMTAPGRYR